MEKKEFKFSYISITSSVYILVVVVLRKHISHFFINSSENIFIG